ncbi:MAG: GNAT family N-acetyltransferase [Candidatus Micrarchaeota archaeon]|nr:GNAT family N-acetyltransferase [Candidatus Micrarchaeota archaeon]
MRIRYAKPGDFKDIATMVYDMYVEVGKNSSFGDYVRLNRPNTHLVKDWFANIYKESKNGHSVYLVAEEKGHVIGHCFVRKRDIPDSERSHVGVLSILVNRTWRNSGVGTRLIKKTLKLSRKKFDVVQLSVLAINKRAIRLYERFGFKRWGIEPMYAKRKGKYIDSVHMYLKL